jgi:hypothetical protein
MNKKSSLATVVVVILTTAALVLGSGDLIFRDLMNQLRGFHPEYQSWLAYWQVFNSNLERLLFDQNPFHN